MKPEATGKAYDQITERWNDDVFPMDNGMDQLDRALQFLSDDDRGDEPNPCRKALDVGCGHTGRFMRYLAEHGYDVEGVDVSAEMIRLAQEKYPQFRFYHKDICQWPTTGQYDFISAWDSIWHVPLTHQSSLITKLVAALKPGGVFIFSFGAVDVAGEHRNCVMGPEIYYSSLGVNGFVQAVMSAGAVVRHLEYDQYPQTHGYMVVQRSQHTAVYPNHTSA
ncbi:methyltransferase type 11 [Thalassolituus sp. HI0120]|nr:methyltransferase type 11 [Thalassolituus sp. HI0120]